MADAAEIPALVKLAFDELKDVHTNFYTLVISSTVTLLVVFGWCMTSESAQKLLRSSGKIVSLLVAGVLMVFATLVFTHWHMWNASDTLTGLIKSPGVFLSPSEQDKKESPPLADSLVSPTPTLPPEYYDHQIIKPGTVILMEISQLAIILFFIIGIQHIHRQAQQTTTAPKS